MATNPCESLWGLFEKTINNKFHAKKVYDGKGFELEEKSRNTTFSFVMPNQDFFAFKLDHAKQTKSPYWLFSDCSPTGVAKMCDGIVVFRNQGNIYIALIELKGTRKDNADRQLSNGKITCEFLIQLFKEYYPETITPKYGAFILYKPRKSPDKPNMTYANKHPVSQLKSHCPLFKIKNPPPNQPLRLAEYM